MATSNTEHIGQYEIIEQTGAGGMATVYKAYHARLDRFVAIKVMHQSFMQDASFLSRFEREARIVARLEHPNIVPVYDYDEYNGAPYLVMKFVEGKTLKDVMSAEPLSLEEIMLVMPKIADALTYAHQMGILHRDVKPSNIILDERGEPYLTDFGLARITQQGESTQSADMMLGTPHYISPEQAQGLADLDGRADEYSFAVILYELVTGRVPFVGDTTYAIVHKHIYAAPPTPSELNPEVPPGVDAVLLKALSKEPNERYATPNAMIDAFRDAVQNSGLRELDEERASVAEVRSHDISERTPRGGKYVSVPAPVDSPRTTSDSTQSRVQQFMQEIGDRAKEVVEDFRQEFETNPTLNKFRQGVKVETNDSGISIKIGRTEDASAPSEVSIVGKNKAKMVRVAGAIERDWSMDEDMVRRRVNIRVQRRFALIIHALVFTIVMLFLFGARTDIQQGLTTLFASPDFITEVGADVAPVMVPLANLRFDLIVFLLWGSGLLSHALSVFYKTGTRYDKRRRELQATMIRRYGDEWMDTVNQRTYKRQKRTMNHAYEQRMGFISHFIGAIAVTLAVGIGWGPISEMLRLGASANTLDLPPNLWQLPLPALVMIFALISVLIHGIVVAVGSMVGQNARERAIDREIEREMEFSQISRATKRKTDEMVDAEVMPFSESVIAPKRKTGAPEVRLNADGEFTESFISEIDADDARSQGR